MIDSGVACGGRTRVAEMKARCPCQLDERDVCEPKQKGPDPCRNPGLQRAELGGCAAYALPSPELTERSSSRCSDSAAAHANNDAPNPCGRRWLAVARRAFTMGPLRRCDPMDRAALEMILETNLESIDGL